MLLISGLLCCQALLAKAPLNTEASVAQASQVAAKIQSDLANSPPQQHYPVRFDNVEILTITVSPIASLPPQTRANLILKNIQSFAESQSEIKGLRLVENKDGIAIRDDQSVLMVITEQDAMLSGVTKSELAKDVLERLQQPLKNYRTKHRLETYIYGSVFTLLSLIGLGLTLYLNRRVFVWMTSKIKIRLQGLKQGLHYKEVELLSGTKIEHVVMLVLRILRIFVVVLCLYAFLPLALSFFPETRQYSDTIMSALLNPFTSILSAVIKYIPNLFYIFVIGVVAHYFLKLISFAFALIERGDLKLDWFYDDWARPTYQIVRFLVIVTALISAYPYIPGSSSEAFQGVGLVLGAIISFASSSAISNIVAGVILTYTRAFRLNDRIKVGEAVGDVVEKTLLVTRLKTIKKVVVTIPNSLVMGAQIINYSTSAADGEGVILHTGVTIGYDVPWKQVESLLIAAALATPRLLKSPEPFVLQTSLDDWYVAYEINAYTKEPEKMALIYSELHKNIQEQFDAAGVEIMSPHYLNLRDGNPSTVPSVLAKPDYMAPGFYVRSETAKTWPAEILNLPPFNK